MSAYNDAKKSLAAAGAMVTQPNERAMLHSVQQQLAEYNGFSDQVRAAGQAGEITKAVNIMTVGNVKTSDTLTETFDKWQQVETKRSTDLQAEVAAQGQRGRTTLIILGVVGFAIAAAGLWLVSRGIVGPLGKAVTSLHGSPARTSPGTLEVDTADETREIADSLNETTASLRAARRCDRGTPARPSRPRPTS